MRLSESSMIIKQQMEHSKNKIDELVKENERILADSKKEEKSSGKATMELSTIMMMAHYFEFAEDLTQGSIFVHLLKKLYVADGETLSSDMSESY